MNEGIPNTQTIDTLVGQPLIDAKEMLSNICALPSPEVMSDAMLQQVIYRQLQDYSYGPTDQVFLTQVISNSFRKKYPNSF